MPDPSYDEQGRQVVRVLDKGTGHTYTELRHVVDGAPDAYDVLDEAAVDAAGRVLPVVHAGKEPEVEGYDSHTVADLKAEIERRNADRPEEDLIPAQGNKPDLIAALEADDNKEN
jgi:hypothetical protein